MYIEPWLLATVAFFSVGMAWSSIARGRTIDCLAGCYVDLREHLSRAHEAALYDVVEGTPLEVADEDFRAVLRERSRLHEIALARTGQKFPHVSAAGLFERELGNQI